MKLPWTPKPPTASLEELREQLANAKATHADAQKATASAQVAFDDAGDPTAEKALTAARMAEQSAGEHLARAQRLASAGEDKRKAEERAELELKRAELTAKVSRTAIIAAGAELVSAECRARHAVADIIMQRLQLAESFQTLQHELNGVLVALGEPRRDTDESAYAASPMDVRNQLDTEVAALATTNRKLADLLRGLIPVNY